MHTDAIFEDLPVAALAVDTQGIVRVMNRLMREYFESAGRGPASEASAFVGLHYSGLAASPELAERLKEFFDEIMATDDTVSMEYAMPRDSGMHPVFASAVGRRVVEDGVVTGAVWFREDATDRTQARTRLSLFEALGSQLPEIVLFTDADGTIIDCNAGATDTLGYERKQLIGSPLSMLSADPDGQKERFTRLLQRRGGDQGLMGVIGADGVQLTLDSRVTVIDNYGELTMCLVSRDVTERLAAERDRERLQRLESLGVLAGGIAHDFNNLLTGIGGRLSLASTYSGGVGPLPRLLDEAEHAVRQASRLTGQLLTFAKGGEPRRERTDLEALVRSETQFATSGSMTRIGWDVEDDLRSVVVDEGQIRQVVQNLVINARQAMKGSGQIEVVLRNVAVEADDGSSVEPGQYVELRITDEGPGISAEIMDRIFEPYFSTKASSGLGLATAYSIVVRHGGTIAVDSPEASGAMFTIRLPTSGREEETVASADDAPADDGLNVTENRLLRVLVMDDNHSLLELVAEMLDVMGHEADGVRHGEEALQLFRTALDSGKPYDAAFLDLTIQGGLGGLETGRELLELAPGLPIFLMSGYHEGGIPNEPDLLGFKGFLPKPFGVSDLRRALQTMQS